jgi:hypothetical protein
MAHRRPGFDARQQRETVSRQVDTYLSELKFKKQRLSFKYQVDSRWNRFDTLQLARWVDFIGSDQILPVLRPKQKG